jgi:hypothetical protein
MTQQPLVGMEQLAIRQPSVEEILFLAVDKGAGIDAIERLAKLKCELDDRKALEAFNEAMNKCQSEMRLVRHDSDNHQTRSRYSSYAALDRALRPIYTRFGLSVSYSTVDCPIPEHIRMVAYVSLGGYTRQYQCDMPADGKGAKGGDVMTKTHAHSSAHMYAKRNLLKDIFNVVTGDEVDDDDGNGGGVDSERLEYIQNSKDKAELSTLYKSAVADAIERKCYSAIGVYQNARDAKLREWQ